MEISEYKDQLALAVEGSAEWRARKAEEYPDDKRNANCARTLEIIGDKLRSLTDDHHLLRRLWWFEFNPEVQADDSKAANRSLELIEAQSRYIGRYGFDHTFEDPEVDEFLEGLISEFETIIKSEL